MLITILFQFSWMDVSFRDNSLLYDFHVKVGLFVKFSNFYRMPFDMPCHVASLTWFIPCQVYIIRSFLSAIK